MLKNLLLGTVALVALASGATTTFAQDINCLLYTSDAADE